MLIHMSECPHCGNGTNTPCFATYDDGYKCFSCGIFKKADRGFVQKDTNNSSVPRINGLNINPLSWSEESLLYLYGYYINNEMISKYHIAEKEPGVLIYQLFDKKELIGYIERKVNPKYVKQYGEKQAMILDNVLSTSIVIVEDWLSAIRVAEVCPSMCLFGTYCKKDKLAQLVRDYETIILWLDGDEAGQKGADKLQYMLTQCIGEYQTKRAFEKPTKMIKRVQTRKDPKEYTSEEITDYIFS